jgi:hypothetical protein
MAVLLATFTDPREAARAAATLRESGFSETTLGNSDGGLGDLVGLGTTPTGFRNLVIIGSTLGGALSLVAGAALPGVFSMALPEIRNMGTVASIGSSLGSLAAWVIVAAVIGAVAGLLGGLALFPLLAQLTGNAVSAGQSPRRPLVAVTVSSRREEDAAREILRDVGPFEVALRA